jgi:hypothetical protein
MPPAVRCWPLAICRRDDESCRDRSALASVRLRRRGCGRSKQSEAEEWWCKQVHCMERVLDIGRQVARLPVAPMSRIASCAAAPTGTTTRSMLHAPCSPDCQQVSIGRHTPYTTQQPASAASGSVLQPAPPLRAPVGRSCLVRPLSGAWVMLLSP